MGGYDDLKPHPDIPDVDWIAFSDTVESHPDWDVRHIEPCDNHPRDVAKTYKLLPHLFLPEYDYTIWIDGSHEVLSPDFAAHSLAAIGDSGIAVYDHPWRQCIYTEAEASVGMEKYLSQPIREQVEAYREEGHPDNWGLYATGTIARRRCPEVTDLMVAWGAEMDVWGYQDQLSFPVVCHRLGVRPDTFPWHQVHGNTVCAIRSHHRED
jgi:hypothetical protein